MSTRCSYCGRVTNDAQFCYRCKAKKLDDLYRATKRSNGWDKKPHPRAAVESGWRGRPVVGGGKLKFIPSVSVDIEINKGK